MLDSVRPQQSGWVMMKRILTVQKAIVFEASPTEERVEGVHGLVARHGLSERAVDVGRTLRR